MKNEIASRDTDQLEQIEILESEKEKLEQELEEKEAENVACQEAEFKAHNELNRLRTEFNLIARV